MKHSKRFAVVCIIATLALVQILDAAPRRRNRRNRKTTVARTYVAPATTQAWVPVTGTTATQVTSSTASQSGAVAVEPIQIASPKVIESTPLATLASENAPLVPSSQVTLQKETLDVGDSIPGDPSLTAKEAVNEMATNMRVMQATYAESSNSSATAAPIIVASAEAISIPTQPSVVGVATGSALAEVNALRAARGLPAFIEDASLTSVAYHKASIQANRNAMGHPGGSMGGARYEGVGMGYQFTSCYLYSNVGRYAGAATVTGRNGQRFHCLLIR